MKMTGCYAQIVQFGAKQSQKSAMETAPIAQVCKENIRSIRLIRDELLHSAMSQHALGFEVVDPHPNLRSH